MAFVGDVEAPVDPYEHVEIDDENLDREVEDVEERLALIDGRVVPWPFPPRVINGDAESRTCAEEDRGDDQYHYLVPKPAAAELLHPSLARYNETAHNERDRQEGYDGVVGSAIKLHVPVNAFGIQVEGVVLLDDAGDDGEETEDDDDV